MTRKVLMLLLIVGMTVSTVQLWAAAVQLDGGRVGVTVVEHYGRGGL
jgi:hypothetical protein